VSTPLAVLPDSNLLVPVGAARPVVRASLVAWLGPSSEVAASREAAASPETSR
jgi:hypothetical protein